MEERNRNGYVRKFIELRAMGEPEWVAFMMANSRRAPWEMARNVNNALPTSYWEAKGLKSLLSLI
ncbi:hypothetical protein DOE73_24845 [Paenibacillus dendritiformis]|nr:hypothetical protein DOE73_24845 [Paenibacillus dendritiformis]